MVLPGPTEDISVFLRLVSRASDFELYVLSDVRRVNFFIKRPGEELLELQYKKYYNGQRVIETPGYRGLGYLFFQNHRQENQSLYLYGNIRDEEIDLVRTSYSINFSTEVTLNNRFVASPSYQVPVTLAQFSNYSPVLSPLQIGVGYKF